MPVLETEIIIAGLVAIAAWVAAFFAYGSYHVSKRSLDLAEIRHDSLRANISAYLADSFRAFSSVSRKGKYVFSIAYSNKSEASDSITEVNLETFYVNSKDRVSHLISAHEEKAEKWLSGDTKPASLPIIIQPRSSVTGWFVFDVPPIAEDSKRVEKFRVVARNGNGEEISVESYILREMKHEESS